MIGAFIPVAVIGLIHGLEPGHGWPMAVVLAHRRSRPRAYALWAALVLGLGHLFSSFVVVGIFIAFDAVFDLSSAVFRYAGGGLLLIVALRFWAEKPEADGGGSERPPISLAALAGSALVLGFAHEEEFALLGLAIGGINPFGLMAVYSVSVVISMAAVTHLAMAAAQRLDLMSPRLLPYLTKVSAIVLAVSAAALIADLY